MKSFTTIMLLITLNYFWAFSGNSIYFFTGKVEILEKGKTAYPAKGVNEQLSADASIKLAENAEVILRNSNGRFAVIHKQGEFTPKQIEEQFALQQGKSLVESLAGFMGSQLANKHDDIRKMSESYMKQKGGVTRAGAVFPLMVWPPYGSVYDTNQVRFVWTAVPGVKRYEFVVFGSEDPNNPVQLSKTLETDTFMDVSFADFGKDKDAYFSWVAYPEGDPNYSRYTFKITTDESLKKMEKDIAETVGKEKTEEDKLLIKAIAYEKAGLVSKAAKVYEELFAKYKSTINQELYSLFKIRNNLLVEGL